MPSMTTTDLMSTIKKAVTESTTKWQLESFDIIKQMAQSLGWDFIIQKDKDGSITMKTFKLVDNVCINEQGIISLIQTLLKVVNKNTFLSDYKDKEMIWMLVEDHFYPILDDLAMNFDIYEIPDIATLERVRSTLFLMGEIAMYRGRDGATTDYLKTVVQSIERLVIGTEPKKDKRKGLL